MIICTCAISLMAIPQIAGNNLTYAVTAIYGLAMSTVYGSGVSLIANYMNVSGLTSFDRYQLIFSLEVKLILDSHMWIFSFSAQLLPMFNPVLCSYLMEFDTENFVYLTTTATALTMLAIPCMNRSWKWLEDNRTLAWSARKEQSDKKTSWEEIENGIVKPNREETTNL